MRPVWSRLLKGWGIDMMPLRSVPEDVFIDMFIKRLYFDLIAEELKLSAPKEILAEVRRLNSLSAAGVVPAVLPVGGPPPVADRAFSLVSDELQRSIVRHGDWSNYSVDQMLSVIAAEWIEVGEAEARDDLLGEHGMLSELAQVAACCVKALWVLGGRV